MIEVIVAGALTIIGNVLVSWLSNRKASALIAYRLEQLEGKVNKHNNLIERVYKLEQDEAVLKEKIDVANHRIEDLEHTNHANQ